MEDDNNTERDKRIEGEQIANMSQRSHLYALTWEDLATVENEILPLARPEAYRVIMSPARKKAIVSLVASAILLVDIVNTMRADSGATGSNVDGIESKLDGIESKLDGGGGGIEGRGGYVNWCLPHPNSPTPKKIPENFPKKILVFYRWLKNLLDLSENIKLSEEEWSRSYELHTIRRESGNPVSTRRVPY